MVPLDGGGRQRHRQTLFGVLLQFCPAACTSQSDDMFPHSALFEGYVKSRGQWFGLAHIGGSEPSNCVGGMMEEGS